MSSGLVLTSVKAQFEFGGLGTLGTPRCNWSERGMTCIAEKVNMVHMKSNTFDIVPVLQKW